MKISKLYVISYKLSRLIDSLYIALTLIKICNSKTKSLPIVNYEPNSYECNITEKMNCY